MVLLRLYIYAHIHVYIYIYMSTLLLHFLDARLGPQNAFGIGKFQVAKLACISGKSGTYRQARATQEAHSQ